MAEIEKQLEPILTEMFARVNDIYSPDKVNTEDWFLKHTWTLEQQSDFEKWLSDYLYKNKDARQAIMSRNVKNKGACKKVASEFTFNFGWKICNTDH